MKDVRMEPSLLQWLEAVSEPGSLVIGSRSGSKATLLGTAHSGRVAVAELSMHGIASLQIRTGVDSILMAFHRNGNLNGSINRQSICRVHGALLGVAMPLEQLELRIESPGASLVLMEVSHTLMDLVTGLYQGRVVSTALLVGAIRGFELALVPLLEGLCRGEKAATASGAMAQQAMRCLEVSVVSLIVRLMPMGEGVPAQRPEEPQSWVTAAESLMRERLQQRLNLSEIAEGCGCSERTLQMAFQKNLGLTPMHRLRELRLDAMQKSLAEGASVRAACAMAGLPASGRTAQLYEDRFGQLPVERKKAGRQKSLTRVAQTASTTSGNRV